MTYLKRSQSVNIGHIKYYIMTELIVAANLSRRKNNYQGICILILDYTLVGKKKTRKHDCAHLLIHFEERLTADG